MDDPIPTSAELADIAAGAARAAAPALMAAFRSSDMAVSFKRDAHDVVTRHDREAEHTITETLLRHAPGSAVLGEEHGGVGSARLRWIVDPVDGTANFARGLAYWCISIAAELDGEIVAGAVLDPVADHLFAADADGARLDGRPMRSAAADQDADATLLTSFPAAHDFEVLGADAALALLRELTLDYRHVHSLGSGALNLAHVAAGWADATMGFDTKPWDVAAGAFILQRAGGWYRGFRDGEPVDRPHRALDYLASGAGGRHRALLERIRALSAGPAPAAASHPASTKETPV